MDQHPFLGAPFSSRLHKCNTYIQSGSFEPFPCGLPLKQQHRKGLECSAFVSISPNLALAVPGSSVIVWKQTDRIISAGGRLIRKDPRMRLVKEPNGISLHITHVTPDDRGARQRQLFSFLSSWFSPLTNVICFRLLYLWIGDIRGAHPSNECFGCLR